VTFDIRNVEEVEEARQCHRVIVQLRPHLASSEEWLERWRRQTESGYRVLAAWGSGEVVAMAGYRIMENLVHGRFLYVDDLATDQASRGRGFGAAILARLGELAPLLGAEKLVLDTAISNALGQRFYFRQGFFLTALRFSRACVSD